MFASLQKNALPLALVLLCAAAMYMVYRDMRRMETRMAQLGALVDSLTDRSRDDEDVFNMLDAVCPLPATRYETVVEEAPAPHPEALATHSKAPAPPVQEDEEMEAEIMAAVEEAIAAA